MTNTIYDIALFRYMNRSAREAFAIIEDLESFPEFMPNVISITLIEVDSNRKVAKWDIMIDDAPLDWVEEGIYDKENLIIRFRSLEGVFERFYGFWQVVPDGEGSRVSFELSYEIGLPEIEEIVGPILRERMIENVESMLNAIEQRVSQPTD